MTSSFCGNCGAPLGGFPFCGRCGRRNPDVEDAPLALDELTPEQVALVALATNEANRCGADAFLTEFATTKAIGREPSAVVASRAVQSLRRLERLLVELGSLSAEEQQLGAALRERLSARATWARTLIGDAAAPISDEVVQEGRVSEGEVTGAGTRRASAVHIDGAQVLAGAGVVLLVAATLLFERGKHSWMIVAPALGLMAVLAGLTVWCRRTEKLAPAGKIFRTATALVLPLVIENIIAAMRWQSVATNRNATIAVGGFACTVVYTGLARTLRSRGFLALGYVAGAATWTALTALLPLHSWRPVAAALLAVGYLGASELTWWPNEETQSPRTRVFGFAPTTALSLFFHAATVLVGALSFINSSPGYLSRGDYHHGVAVVGLTVLAVAYLIVAMRTTQRWSVVAVLLVAPLTAFVTGTWVVAAHAGVIVGVGAASVVALAVVKLGQSSVESSDAFAFVRWSPLLYVALGATAVRYPSWVGVVVLLTVTGVAMVTARLDEVTTTSARWAIATAELAAADALFFAVWRVLIATHHSSIECTASHLLAPAVVVSIVFLARAWWTRSRYEVVTVHPAYLPALVSLLVAVSSSLRGASAHHGYLAASVLTGYAIAVWYSAARLRLIWLVFGSAALLSGAQAVLLHVHGPIVWLPGLSVAASIFAATVYYVNRRMKDSTLHYVFWGLVLFVLAPLLRSEYRQYQVVGTVATAYAVLAVTVVYAALVWYAAHRLRYRWAVFAAGALLSGGVSTVITAYGSVQWLSPVAVGLIMAITTLYVAFVMRWLPLVLLAGALLTYAASIALRVEVGAAWAPLAAIVAAVLFFGARPLPSFTVAGVRWLPSWLDDAGRYALDSWRTALSTTQLLLLNGGLLWSGVLLHRDGYPGAIVTTVFIVVTTAPRLRLGRSRWTLLEYVLTPLSLSGVAPVLAVVLHQHNLQYFNLVPASTLLALSVTIIDRDLGPARVQVLEVARLTSALALVILFGTTLSQAFGGSGASSNLARLWFMVEAVVVLLVGVRTRTRVSALVGSAGVIASVLLTLSHSGNQIGGYLTAVALAIVLLFVALSQIAQRGEGSIGERTREVWAQWR